MSEPVFCNKLVRDGQQIIIQEDDACIRAAFSHTTSVEEYERMLRDKLVEEIKEYLADTNDLVELADIYEVIMAIGHLNGVDIDKIAAAKRDRKGGFSDGLVLLWYQMA